MDYSIKTRDELVNICKHNRINGYGGKSKTDIINLICSNIKDINIKDININISTNSGIFNANNNIKYIINPETNEVANINLLNECLNIFTINEIAYKFNVSIGTIKRWIELCNVPIQYTFDLYKLLSKEIDYSKYSYSLKDQFYTPNSVALKCWQTFIREISINIQDYTFIEPSAGTGSFLSILPKDSIGIDIEPYSEGIIKYDYLSWQPVNTAKKYIVFGNPPFGLRGHMALNFINHSYSFADYVCFILPQLFESDGKGSPRKRVKGYNLFYSERISTAFYNPDSQEIKINCVFQIWSKYTTNPKYNIKAPHNINVKVYSLSNGGTVATTRNKNMIDKCDIYLPSTCFGKENMKVYMRFEDLPGKKGYGIVFGINQTYMINKANSIDWVSISFLSTNSAYNLRTSIILAQFV